MKKPQLLAPAGDLFRLKMAIMYGADAVFIGGKKFSLRSRANNFTIEDIAEGVRFANSYGAKVLVTTNIIPHEEDLNGLEEYLIDLDRVGVYAVICSSPYVMEMVKRLKLKIRIHLSTQTSTLNLKAIEFWEKQGVNRVVLGRELSLENIRNIKENAKSEIEVFIHGGLCVSYSGRCSLSNNLAGRDANGGGCAHSCRWQYKILENDNMMPDSDFLMGSRDLMSLELIPKLMDIGVDVFKIEGRMKTEHYIATVVSSYRRLIDEYFEKVKDFDYSRIAYFEKEIKKCENRPTCLGFMGNKFADKDCGIFNLDSEKPNQEYLGYVEEFDLSNNTITFRQRNHFSIGETVEIFMPSKKALIVKLDKIFDEKMNEKVKSNTPLDKVKIIVPEKVELFSIIRKV